MQMPLVRVAVEGNLGAGKSTFIEAMKEYAKRQRWEVMVEPIDSWTDVCGKGNLLDRYYKDMPRWGYTFQSYAYQSRLQRQTELEMGLPMLGVDVVVYERSCFSDRFVFGEAARMSGNMDELEFAAYSAAHKFFAEILQRPFDIHGVIYLRATPKTCLERVNKRSRSEESSVDMEYLTTIHKLHEDWLMHKKGPCEQYPSMCKVPVLVVNVDEYNCEDVARRREIFAEVDAFIKDQVIEVLF
ncbi:deoxyguanosine kinase [Cyprinid herpesvirus 3]|nr:unnamed protein product [Cyprinid herpesvirus 3]ABF81799.1 hypothetical protein [Cyprinid herpesvirus 3]ABG42850.1 deoxyguanosine kinase [Cyprinid herpesvirus 3]AIC32374.1 ORF19R [Cyprinid herpesvirus 3]AJP55513.1 deoxyguanosine kinase [Cyprinid herpesvirus 3]AJP55670.1 deoxyguanosine kinase [Cyprinid herpesvirus 3]